jgi:hypothetical protein
MSTAATYQYTSHILNHLSLCHPAVTYYRLDSLTDFIHYEEGRTYQQETKQ